MKKFLACLLAVGMMLSLASCSPKEMVQDTVREVLGADASSEKSSSTAVSAAADSDDSSDADTADASAADSDDSGGADTANADWVLRMDEVTVMDVMGLASVTYDIDLTATHDGADMFGEYTGELAMEYAADLGGLQAFLDMSGVSMDYETDGWFKNTSFRMELAPYSEEDETRFSESLKDPTITDEERELTNSYMSSFLGDIGSGDKDFETSGQPVGFWYDWAFHMTEGDMSAYMNMTSAMFTASASQDEKGQNAQGYADHIIAGSFHESLSYEDESPFPYQIEVYEGGEAVLTLRSATESPIVVKFYGTLTKK
jgi:hypothetical protein